VRSRAVSTVKKSHAMIPCAWARRNSAHVGPARRGAGPSRAARSRVRIVVAPTRMPSLRSSPSDPDAAPARVLPGKSQDERTEFGIDRRPARATGLAVRPFPAYELAVPAEERRRRDKEGDPAVTRDHPARRREQDPVDGPELRPARRPLQHPELMAQDEDLEVLGTVVPVRSTTPDKQPDEGADDEVEERPHHPIVLGGPIANRGF
jgi:hypothetical protein